MNKLNDFHNGVKVLWDLRDGQQVEGEVIYVTSAGNVGVQWQDEPEGKVYDYHHSDEHLSVLMQNKQKSNMEFKTTEINSDSTEDKIKELIIHLVQVNQIDRACEIIEVLKKYKSK